MPEPITGDELKLRGYEAPLVTHLENDHVAFADGPINGPVSIIPAYFVGEGIKRLPNISPSTIEGRVTRIPLTYKDINGTNQQGVMELSALLSGGQDFYLGPKQFPPATDNYGQPLKIGMTYYNTSDERIYVWVSGLRWAPGGSAFPATVRSYYYTFNLSGNMVPPGGPGAPDAYGNVLNFDISAGQGAINAINLFINGALLVNGTDYVVHEGGIGGDYISLADSYCVNSVAVVQIISTGDTVFVPNAIQANTTGWVFNGAATTFPLVNMANEPINPASATNVMLSFNGTILQPGVEFQLVGTNIVFTTPPAPGSTAWAVVGVPVGGGAVRTISPANFGAVGDGVNDDTLAVANAINRMISTGATLDLSGGKWRITAPLPAFGACNIEGLGSGEVYVDYDPEGVPILDCMVVNSLPYEVASITEVNFDFNGAFTADSKMTRLTLALDVGQLMPKVGDIGKLTCEEQVPGVETGDFLGEHVFIAAVSGSNVYIARRLYDTFSGSAIQLRLLGKDNVRMHGVKFSSNYANLVAQDWLFEYIRITGAIRPRIQDMDFTDGVQGLTLAGCWKASTHGIDATRMRNATASENPPVPGYGVVDAGSYMSQHMDLDGEDCRHVYTTISPDAASWPAVAWGRAIKPSVIGGKANGCSAAAYDTHSDCLQPTFIGLDVDGAYYGENSAGAGIQLRGIRGLISRCRVRNTPVGYEIYKQFNGEAGGHIIDDCEYVGWGTPIRAEHEDALTGGNERQTLYVGNFKGETTGQIGIDLLDADLILTGEVAIIHTGNQSSVRAVFEREASTVRSQGRGTLVHDISAMTGPPVDPRTITFSGANCGAAGLLARVRAGSNPWQAVVSENDVAAATVAAGAFRIDCDCDIAPGAASGGYSQAGASNLLPAGGMILRLTVDSARTQAAKTGAFSLTAAMHGQTILCNGTFTVSVPAVGVLGPEFRCTIVSVTGGGTITLDGPGGSNPTIAAGSKADVAVMGSSVTALVSALTAM